MSDIRMDEFSLHYPGQTVHVASWFAEKENVPDNMDAVITGESDKAFFVYFEGGLKKCIPKSQVSA